MGLKIFTTDDKSEELLLRQHAEPVQFPLSAQAKALIREMKIKAIELGGVGLAAPQVGVSLQIIVIHIDSFSASIRKNAHTVPLTVLINPEYDPEPGAKLFEDWEGCFSVCDLMGKPKRHDRIRYRGYNEAGERIEDTAVGFFARVLQHEIDHIRGTLMVDRLDEGSVRGPRAKMMEQRLAELSDEQRRMWEERFR